jgi:ankyrin repeat protein
MALRPPLKIMVKSLGLLYLVINLVAFSVIFLMAIKTMHEIPAEYSPGWILLIFPASGILSGYWIFNLKFGWLRSLLIIISVLMSLWVTFLLLFVIPKLEDHQMNSAMDSSALRNDAEAEGLFIAVQNDSPEAVASILNRGIDVNSRNEVKETALHLSRSPEVTKLLIQRGADIEAKDDLGLTPLFHKEVELAKLLVAAGADIDARSNDGNTPFMWYCYSGYLEGMKYMFEKGAKVNTCNNDGNNAKYIVDHFQPNTEAFYYVMSLGIPDCND